MKIRNIIIFSVFLLALLPFCMAVQTGKASGSIGISSINDMIYVGVTTPYCGDNILQHSISEQCDGSNLGGETCESLGYDSGTLSCQSSCVFDTIDCANDATNGDTGDTGGGGTTSGGGSSSSGGGSSSCIENWQCKEWEECKDATQTRTCEDLKKCSTEKIKPDVERACSSEGLIGDEALRMFNQSQESNQGFFNRITGAVIGGGKGGILVPLLFIIIVVGLLIITLSAKKKVVARQDSEGSKSEEGPSEDVVTEDVDNVLEDGGEDSASEE